MSVDNLQKVEMTWVLRNLWKLFLRINLCAILLFPLAQYWGQSVICDYHRSVALIGWLPLSTRERERCGDGEKVYGWLTVTGEEAKTFDQNERLDYFLQPAHALFIKRAIYHSTFGKSLIYLGPSLGNVKLDKENWIDGLPKRSEDHPVAFNIYLDNLSRQNLIEKRFIKCNIRGIWKAAKKYSFLGLCPKHPPTV